MAEVRRGIREPVIAPVRLKLRFRFAPVLVSLVLVLALGGGTAFAAQNDLPGEPLYGVKIISERVAVALAPSPKKKVELEVIFASRRAEEVKALLGKIDQARAEDKAKLEQTAAITAEWLEVQIDRAEAEATTPESTATLNIHLEKLQGTLDETVQEAWLEVQAKARIEKLKSKIRAKYQKSTLETQTLPTDQKKELQLFLDREKDITPTVEAQPRRQDVTSGVGEWVTPIQSRPIEPNDLSPYFVPTLPSPSPSPSPVEGEGVGLEVVAPQPQVEPAPDRELVERELVAVRELFEAMSSRAVSRVALEPALELIVNADFELARDQIKEAQTDIRTAVAILEQIKSKFGSEF